MAQDLQLNKRCHLCQNFSLDNGSWPLFADRHPFWFPFHNINELIQSAKEGCHVCNLIVTELSESRIRDLQRELEDNPQLGSQQLSISSYKEGLALKCLTPGGFDQRHVYLVEIHISRLFGE
ncbi:hypothetical protein JMJ35_002972 [Cladonia borealis]|uniref:Uncharacterized protein n=1 Tax=Cladonia borealis TaxID=184061 RepID=A0AA39R5V0_9LECA|nr:hypothetical protein JMJ35_002972 [Cladonia borealis]